MADLLNGVILILVMLFLFRVVAKSKRDQVARKAVRELATDFKPNPANTGARPTGGTKTTGVADSLRGGTAGSVGAKKGDSVVRYSMEDRKHDWLARQLSEEYYAKKKMSEMFGLREVHSNNCDARAIRNEHAANCDAHGVDTASSL